MLRKFNKKYKISALVVLIIIIATIVALTTFNINAASSWQAENLGRGIAAIKVDNGVYISWRLWGTEDLSTAFNVYRNGTKITSSPITNSTNYTDTSGTTSSTYSIAPVVNGAETGRSETVGVWGAGYWDIKMQVPSGGTTPDGVSYTYSANDCSAADLDNDGEYEIIVKWDPSNSKDNSQSGYTGNVYLDAYKMNGTRMWRINLGKNIRAGAHYTQFIAYDLDGNGVAEIACKIADGTVDGTGAVFGSSSADYRNSSGYILSGPEYLGIFSGGNGRLMEYVSYVPPRGTVSSWGDSYGNRVDRFLAGVAYLDGVRPSLIMCRGYYTRAVVSAWDYRDGNLTNRWTFDSNNNTSYAGQGNHQLSVADVDSDGKDEIIYGSCTIDDNGSGKYNSGYGHGDALHVGDFDPSRAGLEIWSPFESGSTGAAFRSASNGSTIFKYNNSGDVGRACIGDISPDTAGAEMWASGSPLYDCKGNNVGSNPGPTNFMIWWDGDTFREFLDGTKITKFAVGTLLNASNNASNNGTKATPCLSADLFGDWREEVIFRTADSSVLTIYPTLYPTDIKIHTLMHDRQYRCAIAWQNVAYNQPPHPSFFIGDKMAASPKPNIYLVGNGNPNATTGGGTTTTQAPTTQSPTSGPVTLGVEYSFVNRHSGLVLEVEGGSTEAGANIIQWEDNEFNCQNWIFESAGTGYYKIKNANSQLYLEVQNALTDDGADITQWSDTGHACQEWSLQDAGGGYYIIVNRNSGKALDDYEWSTTMGTEIRQWTNAGGNNQQWSLVKQ